MISVSDRSGVSDEVSTITDNERLRSHLPSGYYWLRFNIASSAASPPASCRDACVHSCGFLGWSTGRVLRGAPVPPRSRYRREPRYICAPNRNSNQIQDTCASRVQPRTRHLPYWDPLHPEVRLLYLLDEYARPWIVRLPGARRFPTR